MPATRFPLPPRKPDDVIPAEVPETDAPVRDFPEGPLPGMPVATDPLLQPSPHPAPRERRPLD
ncbi:hypothetical protein PRN20_09235 [Devosia sp. ZB163]|uniref:hypothetical protein n=1 Tax=Devosia sp. ZB163 TaxID=3025938 RepID=UPI00235E062D|nr:hypothetical protein [Devosia sp. ZB163]MDC9823917.1 hypothetical protein [Devosia sp. ZB163]